MAVIFPRSLPLVNSPGRSPVSVWTSSLPTPRTSPVTIFVGSDGSTAPLLQAGGFSDFNALEGISWDNGASGDDGTACIDTRDLVTPVDPFAIAIGNGDTSGGNGT